MDGRKMIDAEKYINELTGKLLRVFENRLVYVGLQGSYLRNEATLDSDIDVMVVIDGLTVSDMEAYRKAIVSLGGFEKSCGFICGAEELSNWNPLEICHLLHTTRDYYGKLSDLVPSYSEEDTRNFVKLSLGNLYHELCHRYIHSSREKNAERLAGTYKSAFFILQDMYFLRTGSFAPTKAELEKVLSEEDRPIFDMMMSTASGCDFDFDRAFELIFNWCKDTLNTL